IQSPADAVHLGIGYLSEDRKRYGLAVGMDVETNIVLATLRKFADAIGRVDFRKTRATAEQRVNRLGIKTPSIKQKVRNLSGGNQQKVVIAKWLTADTEILIFDEPTRGIDVGAKSEIYHLLNELAKQGKAIIMISSELPEILRMSHRIVVMCEGRIRGELSGAEATQEKIMTFATMRATTVNGVLALGVTFVIITGGIDLSIGTVMTLSAVMTGTFATVWQLPLPLAVVAGLGTGALAGLVNGMLIAKLKIPSFIATLGMLNIAKGLALVISGLKPIYFNDTPEFNRAAMGSVVGSAVPGLDIPNITIVFLLAAIIAS